MDNPTSQQDPRDTRITELEHMVLAGEKKLEFEKAILMEALTAQDTRIEKLEAELQSLRTRD